MRISSPIAAALGRVAPVAGGVLFSLLLALLSVSPSRAATVLDTDLVRVGYRGELRSLGLITHFPNGQLVQGLQQSTGVETRSINDIRLMIWGSATAFFSFEAAYQHQLDLTPPSAALIPTYATPPPTPARFLDLEWDVHGGDDLVWTHAFDRLNGVIRLPWGDGVHVILGRQSLRWGYGHIWTPADRFSPKRPIELFRRYAPGLDAVQVRAALGALSELRLVFVPAKDLEGIVALARLDLNLGAVDLAATVGDDRDHALFGLGARAALGPVELSAAGTLSHGSGGEDTGAAVLSVTAQLPLGVVGTLEFSYDGAGAGAPADYAALWASDAWKTGRLIDSGRWYAGIALDVHPLPRFEAGGRAIVNIIDGSAALLIRLRTAIADEAWVTFSAMMGIGDAGSKGTPGSEFGVMPRTYSMDIRLFF